MLSKLSNLFLQDATKIGLYLVIVFGKRIKFHLNFFVFCFLAFGTCRDKTHVQIFDRRNHDQAKGNGNKETCDIKKKVQWKLGET
jgi:hypothetical protein